jgi:hypothetical protein
MTAAERVELGKLVRLNAKVAKDEAEARGLAMLADAEAKLAARFKMEDEMWADITATARKQVEEANAAIAALCRQRGVPEEFRPELRVGWFGRGENAYKERRAELRRLAQAQVEAVVKEAKVEIDRAAAEQITHITQCGLTSQEARAFIEAMPSPGDLMPPIRSLRLNNGQVVSLEAPVTAVTPQEAAVTDSRIECAFCGKAFTPGRSDGKYCRTACRVADCRRRQKAAAEPAEGGGA